MYIALFIWLCIGTLYSLNINTSIFYLEKSLSYIAIPIIFFSNSFSKNDILFAVKGHVYSCLVAIVICALNAIYLNCTEAIELNRGFSYYNPWYFSNALLCKPIGIHPTYFSVYLTFSFFALAIFKFFKRQSLHYLALTLFIGMIIMLSSRMVIISLIISIFILTIGHKFISRKKIFIALSIISSLIIIDININDLNKTRVLEAISFNKDISKERFGGKAYRLKIWSSIIEEFQKESLSKQIIGVGSGDGLAYYHKIFYSNNLEVAYKENYNAHNQYIDYLVHNGLIGLILFLIILLHIFIITLNPKIPENIFGFKILLQMLVCIVIFSMLTESLLYVQKGIVFFVFYTCALYHIIINRIEENSNNWLSRYSCKIRWI
ncbi:O-antigen ligase family protein [Flammeovirgaceae bacterium SG7u.111]|nr:O-antigen ligase family protein [Flammeovirgaceae bacterium SG7u.132]WPO34535.1 O-antigen ligase family protein [Flammeovirgaceae bacterium SG7u.111]